MAERHHAGVADQDVGGHRQQSPDQDLGDEPRPERRQHQRRDDQQRHDDAEAGPVDDGVALAHLGVATNRPVGRTSKRDDEHDERHDHRLRRADPDRGVSLQQADQDRGRDRAAEIAHAADHDDDEGLQHPVETHGVVDADQRPEQHAARRSHPRADREGRGVDPRHRNAHRLRHDAVLRGGPDPDAVFAVFQEQPEAADDGGRERRDQDAVIGIGQVEQRERAGDRLVDLARHRPELPQRVVLQDQRHAEGGEDRGQRIAPDQRTQRHDLHRARRISRPAAWRGSAPARSCRSSRAR